MTLWAALSGRAGGVPRGAVVAAFAVGAVLLVGCAPESDGGPRATLAGSETTPESPTPDPDSPQIDPAPSPGETPVGGRPWNGPVTATCADSVGAAFEQVAQIADGSAVTSFWSAGKRWAVCDVLLDPETAEPLTLTSHTSAGVPRGFDETHLSLSTSVLGDAEDPESVRFAAGGPLPWPVQEISYTFPDAHTERARFVASADGSGDTWWAVGHTVTEGPLADPTTSPTDLDPVTISIVGPAAEAFRLPWEAAQRTE